jgi:putative ABC transport system permease protein
MRNLLQDLRYGLRMLVKNRAFSVVAIFALALGIGANTAIFSVVNAVLLRPLPYRNSDRMVMLWGNFQKLGIERTRAKAAEYEDYRAQNQSFDRIAAFSLDDLTLTGSDRAENLVGARVTASLFTLLGAQALTGRVVLPEDNQMGRNNVAVLSHGFWQRRLGGDQNVIGQTLTLNGQIHTIVGVMPAGFQFPHEDLVSAGRIDLWTPLAFTPEQITERRRPYYLNVVARLKAGVTLEEARADLAAIARRMDQPGSSYRGPNNADGGWRVTVNPIQEEVVGGSRRALIVLFIAVGLVLLIACANVANLLLARATARQREMAIRSALGASRARIIRQLLIESLLLAVVGGAAGLLLALWGVESLTSLGPANLPRVKEIGVDGSALAFTTLVSILTGLIFGLAPAWQASKPEVTRMLKEGGVGAIGGWRRASIRNALVVAEIAVALVVLIGAGLMINSLLRLQRVNPGVAADKLLTAYLNLPATKYGEPAQAAAFYQELLRKVESLPGAESASLGTVLPLGGQHVNDPFVIEGRPLDFNNAPVAGWQRVTPNHFRTLGIQLIAGRDFTERDNTEASPVVIISEQMARRYWPNENPIGKRVTLGLPRPDNPWSTIVGVVRDVRRRTDESKPEPDWYLPYFRQPSRDMYLFVRAASDPASLASAVREQVREIDREQPVTEVRTMNEVVAATTASRRFNTLALGVFAAVALILAALGVYGVISYSVTQRTQEIGVRMALGARGRDVLRLVVRQAMALVAIGVVIGLIAAIAFTRVMKSLLFEVSVTDPLTFAAISLLLAVIALLACWIPARRAAKADPMIALRHE